MLKGAEEFSYLRSSSEISKRSRRAQRVDSIQTLRSTAGFPWLRSSAKGQRDLLAKLSEERQGQAILRSREQGLRGEETVKNRVSFLLPVLSEIVEPLNVHIPLP
jgi:hypothetical protein